MTPERWQQIKDTFDIVEHLTPEQRSLELDRLAANDPELRQQVLNLFEEFDGSFIEDAIAGLAQSLGETEPVASAPGDYGRYRVVRRIGQGGMGAVYEATRVDDFQKRVALKVIRHEFDSDYARSRFLQERQLLAVLEHPYIARLIDGGETETGTPYLVLEYVDGIPFSEFCEKLSLKDRLRLFLKVCEGVEYAHRNLIIHRDLKPGNILVTAEGEPKLLDFGIAKLIDPSATLTQTALLALTPDYASPEQVRGEPISTASDVYSLGVILYQVLTGRRPYKIDSTNPLELDRIICQEPPAPPALGDEIDHILLMALRKEPSRRYASVQHLAEDIERYLANEPVKARPETVRYLARKFVTRHRLPMAAAVLLLASVAAGFYFTYQEKQRAQQRFADVRQLANRFLFDFEGKIHDLPGATPAREMVVTTALEYLNRLAADAKGDRDLTLEIAQGYTKTAELLGAPAGASLGKFKEALATHKQAQALLLPLQSSTDPRPRRALAETLERITGLNSHLRDYKSALATSAQLTPLTQALTQADPSNQDLQALHARAMAQQGDILLFQEKPEEAIPLLRASVDLAQKLAASSQDPDTKYRVGIRQGLYAEALEQNGQLEEAIRAHEAKRDILIALIASNPTSHAYQRALLVSYIRLANLRGSTGRPSLGNVPAALADYERASAIAKRLFDADPRNDLARQDYALSLGKIADLLEYADPKRSLAMSEAAFALLEQGASSDDRERNGVGYYMAICHPLMALNRGPEAEVKIRQGIALFERLLKAAPQSIELKSQLGTSYAYLGELRQAAKDYAGAKVHFARSLELQEPLVRSRPDNLRLQYTLYFLFETAAANAAKSGDAAEAAQWRAKNIDLWQQWVKRAPSSTYGKQRLAQALAAANPPRNP